MIRLYGQSCHGQRCHDNAPDGRRKTVTVLSSIRLDGATESVMFEGAVDMDWISSLRAPQITQLLAGHGPLQLSLFDERNLMELRSEHFPGERLVVCCNPLLATERARKHQDRSRLADDSFNTLLKDLATLNYNITHTRLNPEAKIVLTTRPAALQDKAFKLLAFNPACTQ